MVKLGPFTRRDFCNAVRGEEERFTTHLAMMLSASVVPLLVDVTVVVGILVVAVVVLVVLCLNGHLNSHASIHQNCHSHTCICHDCLNGHLCIELQPTEFSFLSVHNFDMLGFHHSVDNIEVICNLQYPHIYTYNS